jgi:sarcosine oxidase/L-pipecolate oxidase
MTNYRPISLLTSFSKVVQKVTYARLHQNIMSNNISVNEQYGFRSNSSIEMASYTLINKILNAPNNKILVSGIFCDLKKAFDCVSYDILLSKVEFYGTVGEANALVKVYLEDRYQRVVNNNWHIQSGWGKVK